MPTNIPKWERVLRVLLGIGALSFYGALDAPWRYVTLLGLLVIGTGLAGYCPLYMVLGIRKPAPATKTP